MSNLTDIRQAHGHLRELLNQEIRRRGSNAATLQRYLGWLDTAFYLLAWGNFEYLTRKQAEAVIAEEEGKRGRARLAWSAFRERLKNIPLTTQIELVFHGRDKIVEDLKAQYLVRNASAHAYKKLPAEMRQLPEVITAWEKLVDRFDA